MGLSTFTFIDCPQLKILPLRNDGFRCQHYYDLAEILLKADQSNWVPECLQIVLKENRSEKRLSNELFVIRLD